MVARLRLPLVLVLSELNAVTGERENTASYLYSFELIAVESRALLRELNLREIALSVGHARRFSRNLGSTNQLRTVLVYHVGISSL